MIRQAFAPFDLRHNAIQVLLTGTYVLVIARQAQDVGIPTQLAAENRVGRHVVVVNNGMYPRVGLGLVVQ